jgi:putative membrane-bound dehydrogenase-like protein
MHLLTARLLLHVFLLGSCTTAAVGADLNVLFLGDNGLHQPRERFEMLEPVLRPRGIMLTYTENIADLNAAKLAEYDALLLYANIDSIEPPQEKALLEYVAGGGGFVPLHCASFCFRNSEALVALIGAQFKEHGWGPMRETVAAVDHPVIEGYAGFESTDETYVHHLHNERDRTVLSYRVDGQRREPWTWVRWHGKGRVFYTAWGHDHHTWRHPGFHNLVERGLRWAAGDDPVAAGPYTTAATFPLPKMTTLPEGPPPFKYVDVGAKIPNYVPSEKWGVLGDPITKMQLPLPAEESMRRMVTPEGFHVELFAAEPELGGKPLAMTWDERGRLWLVESVDYPNELQPKNQGRDRIRICEDTDGDGRADKFTVFAEGLSIPTSIAFARGGVIVHNGTQTLFLKDADGDDRADERSVLLEPWAMNDTHGGPSNMQYGLDNWIWGMQGYNKTTIRIGDRKTSFAQGFHRFRADGSAFEFVRSTNNNTWGLGISEEGIVFGSTANGNPSEYMPIANRYYERVRGWTPQLTLNGIADSARMQPITDKIRQVDHHGRHTAAAGHALYTARAYPREYWNSTAFVCEPTGHLVGVFLLSADGAGYRSTSPFNLLASDDEWTAPTMAEVGPDGSVWVIDWYNYIVQHNPTPEGFETGKGAAYESELRDKKHARIYRVVYDNAPAASPLDLSNAAPAELVKTLAHDNLFWRRHAQRLLVERGELDVVPQLLELVGDNSVDELSLNVGVIHALWTLHGLGAINAEHPQVLAAATAALRHPSAGVRPNAVQVLPAVAESTAAILAAGLLDDPDDQVRLQTLLALSDQPPNNDAGVAIAKFIAKPENAADRWLLDAATSAAATHSAHYLIAATDADKPSPEERRVANTVANHFARTNPGGAVTRLIASLAAADTRLAGRVIEGLQAGWPEGAELELDEAARQAIARLRTRFRLEDQIHLARLAIHSGAADMQAYMDELIDALFGQIENPDLELAAREKAARLAIAAQPEDIAVAERLLALATPQASPELSTALIRALRESRAPTLGAVVLDQAGALAPSTRDAVFDLLISRPQLTKVLLDAMEAGAIRGGELSLIHKQRLSDYPDRRLKKRAAELLAKGSESISSDRKQVLADYADVAQAAGDSANGKTVFTKNCAICHKLRGEGAAVGPDLSGMAVHGKEQLLVHLLDPNRDVEGNYVTYTAMLVDGLVVSGMLAGESATSIELVDAEGKRHAILREDVDELSRSGASLMPEGFEKQLSREQLADMLAYLTDNSGFIPLDLQRVATVSSARGMFHSPDAVAERLVFEDWGPKMVDGVPFYPIDPQDGRVRNVVMLHGPRGATAPTMPRSVELKCGAPAKAIHFLSGVSGWGFPSTEAGTVSLVVRLRYADGGTEDHELKNGVHFADYLGATEVAGSRRAFSLGQQQIRYFKIEPKRAEAIEAVELIKGEDDTAPLIMAVTAEQ